MTTFRASYILSNLLISDLLLARRIIISKMIINSSWCNRFLLFLVNLVCIDMIERGSIFRVSFDGQWILFCYILFKWNIIFRIVRIFCALCIVIVILFFIIFFSLFRFGINFVLSNFFNSFIIVTLYWVWWKGCARNWIIWVHIYFVSYL